MRVALTEKLTCEWQSGDVNRQRQWAVKDPPCPWGIQWRARRPLDLNEMGKAREVWAIRSCRALKTSQRIWLFCKRKWQVSCIICLSLYIGPRWTEWEKKIYWGSRRSRSPVDVPRVRVGRGWAETFFGSNLSCDHNVVLVSTVRMWNEAGVSL